VFSCKKHSVFIALIKAFDFRLFSQIINPPLLDPIEVEKYHELTRTGMLYEHFAPLFNLKRDDAKKRLLGSLYAPNNSFNFRKEQRIFLKEFPTIGRLIQQLKAKTRNKDYSDFAVALQMVESEIFIDGIATRLYEQNNPVYTVHDSVIVKDEYAEKVLQVIEEVFMIYFGGLPQFKKEKLSVDNLELLEAAMPIQEQVLQLQAENLLKEGVFAVREETIPPSMASNLPSNLPSNKATDTKPIITPYEAKTIAMEAILEEQFERARDSGEWEIVESMSQALSARKYADKKYKISQRQRIKIEMELFLPKDFFKKVKIGKRK
jgi:hypothetical protein